MTTAPSAAAVAPSRRNHTNYLDETYEVVSRWTEATLIEYGPNRKRQPSKSYDRYEIYAKATTVGEALALGSYPPDLLWDYEHGHLKVVGGFIREEPLDISKVEDDSELTETDHVIHRWYRRELARKLGLHYKDLFVDKAGGESTFMRAHRLVAQREAAKILEAAHKERRRITDQEVEHVLHEWAFARNSNRVNVTPDGQTWVWSDTLGLIMDRVGHIHITSPSLRYPEVVQVICQWLKDHLPPDAESFFFTSINMNCNYAAKLHRDGNNFGPSMIKAFGPFTGGELNYFPEDDKSQKLEDLSEEDQVQLDIKHSLALFNGNCGHWVENFKGERYSVVFFTLGRHHKASDEDKAKLRELGVAFPGAEPERHALLRPPRGTGPKAKAAAKSPTDGELLPVRSWKIEDLEALPYKHEKVWTKQVKTERKEDAAAAEDAGDEEHEEGSTPEKKTRKARAAPGAAPGAATPPAKRARGERATGSDEKQPPAKAKTKLALRSPKELASLRAKAVSAAKEAQVAKDSLTAALQADGAAGSPDAVKAAAQALTKAAEAAAALATAEGSVPASVAAAAVKPGTKPKATKVTIGKTAKVSLVAKAGKVAKVQKSLKVKAKAKAEAETQGSTPKSGSSLCTAESLKAVSTWTKDTRLEYVPNGKRAGTKSYDRYQAYSVAKTVGEALLKGSLPSDLLFDFERGLLKIVGGPFQNIPVDLSQGSRRALRALAESAGVSPACTAEATAAGA